MEMQSKDAQASRSTFAGLFLICLATLMYEILLTRIFSVIMWYHFAFMAVSVAMFGMTVGAILVYLFPGWFSNKTVSFYLAVNSWLFSVTILLSFVVEIYLPFVTSEITKLVSLTYVITLVPFIFSGICVSLILTRFPEQLNKLYATDLIGAACGCILLIYLLKFTDGPTAMIAFSALVSLGSLFFALKARTAFRTVALVSTLLLFAFTGYHTVLVKQGRQWLRVVWAKEKIQSRPLYERWNSFSRIQVKKDRDQYKPTAWGMSSAFVPDRKVPELRLNIDASAATVLTKYHGNPAEMEHLKYDVTNLVHYVRRNARVLVVGMGGGRDVLSALVFQQNSVIGVEINDQILEAVNEKFGDFTGHLHRDPRVKLVNDEARSFIARTKKPFDIIQVSLIDTWAATAAGAFALSENSLYTLEAWKLFLSRLSQDGILSFSRWYSPGKSPGLYRLASLATASLKEIGVSNPANHMVIVASNPKQKKKRFKGVATLLVCKRPFSVKELEELELTSKRLDFRILFSPTQFGDRNSRNIIQETKPLAFGFDISPPTDDRPFFFSTIQGASWNIWKQGSNSEGNAASFLMNLLVLVLILTVVCVFLPLLMTVRKLPSKGMWSFFLFFAAIGIGFMMIEISQMQRLAIFLGHPTYSLSVVLFTLLLSSGIGSYLTGKISQTEILKSGMVCLLLLLLTVSLFGVTTVSMIKYFEGSSTPIRILVSALILAPMGFCLGTAFPLGMRMASLKLPEMSPWFWGVNGAASVWSSIVAVMVAILWGISISFWIGFASYTLAFLAFLLMKRIGLQGLRDS
jgi:Spermine/spermidine synthase domain